MWIRKCVIIPAINESASITEISSSLYILYNHYFIIATLGMKYAKNKLDFL